MAKFRSPKNSLLGGEISRAALGRTDLPQYPAACELLRNMIPMLAGGAYRRPGTRNEQFFDATTDYAPALIPFIVSKSEAYSLLLGKEVGGNGYIRAFRATDNISLATLSFITGTHPYRISTVGTTGTVGYYDEWHDVQYVQSADILSLVHPNHKPRRVTRTATDTFFTNDFDFDLFDTDLRDAWPYRPMNTTLTTIRPSATIGSGITLTASAAFFNAGHVGAMFKINHAGTIGAAKITAFTDSTHVTADVVVTFGGTTAVLTWWESAWSDYRGWPRTIGFYQQRLAYGGNASEPDSIWFSETADYNQLSHAFTLDFTNNPATNTTTALIDPRSYPTGSMAFTIQLSSNQLNLVQWMMPALTLVLGTSGDEWIIDREIDTQGFGCDNAKAVPQTSFGSAHLKAVRVGGELIFAQAAGDELKSLIFSQLEDSYVGDTVQLLFDEYPKSHPTTGARKYRTYAWDETRKTLWCCDTVGNLFGMTRERRLQVTAWHTHQLGGYDASKTGGTLGTGADETYDPAYSICSGSAISLCLIPNPIIGTNDLWLVVKRKINGAFQYHLDRMVGRHMEYDSAYQLIQNGVGNYFTDSSVYNVNEFPSSEDDAYSGLFALEGETVVGTASNSYGLVKISGSAVSSGITTIQLPKPTGYLTEPTAIVFGLPFTSVIKPVRVEAGSVLGTSQGAIKRIHEATVRFLKTLSAKLGRDADHLDRIDFRAASTPMGKSAELYSGDKTVLVAGDYDRDGYLYITQEDPLPFAVVSIFSEGVTND